MNGVDQVTRHLVELEALPQGGLIKDVERLVMKAGKVGVEQGVWMDVWGLFTARKLANAGERKDRLPTLAGWERTFLSPRLPGPCRRYLQRS